MRERKKSNFDGDDGVIGESVVGDHRVLTEDGEVDRLGIIEGMRIHCVARVHQRELLSLHLVAFARTELCHRLVRLHDRQNIHRFVRLHLRHLRDGREIVVLRLDVALAKHLLDLRYRSRDRREVTEATGGQLVLVLERIVAPVGEAHLV